MCVLVFSATYDWNISHSKKKWARQHTRLIVKYSLLLSNFNGTRIFSTYIQKNIQNQMSLKSNQRESRIVQKDVQTHRQDKANSRFSQLYERA